MYTRAISLAGALIMGLMSAPAVLAAVNISTGGPNVSVGTGTHVGRENWRCVATGRNDKRYRATGVDRNRARDNALNYCEKHTRNCRIERDGCERI